MEINGLTTTKIPAKPDFATRPPMSFCETLSCGELF